MSCFSCAILIPVYETKNANLLSISLQAYSIFPISVYFIAFSIKYSKTVFEYLKSTVIILSVNQAIHLQRVKHKFLKKSNVHLYLLFKLHLLYKMIFLLMLNFHYLNFGSKTKFLFFLIIIFFVLLFSQ